MQATVHEFADDGSGSVLLDDGLRVPFTAEAFAHSTLRLLRVGQRVSIERDGETGPVVRLWLTGVG
ncbi:hypothetical protein [Angustibacter aerolatus]|uniref:Cold-shock protein n=1 Tax=Angustibacter aerolatus TaxID=1162965 RepID=A0ABQ6JKM1_9ACTN|nr:hypothetical protein GCM10025868_40180 [Angustibacter aerolatus]